MKSALSILFGVAAVAFVAAPVTSFAGGTIAGKVTYAAPGAATHLDARL